MKEEMNIWVNEIIKEARKEGRKRKELYMWKWLSNVGRPTQPFMPVYISIDSTRVSL
jgi:hypothetical protein